MSEKLSFIGEILKKYSMHRQLNRVANFIYVFLYRNSEGYALERAEN